VASTESAQPKILPSAFQLTAPDQGSPTEHILVVEDSLDVLALSKEILEGAGYTVSTAESGEEALAFLKSVKPSDVDLLFTDLVMPGGINGIVLAKEVASMDPDMPVLMTTGYNEELVIEGPMASGLDVLGKPYRRSDLLDRVRQAINQQGRTKHRRYRSDYGSAEE
jgi:CheY-like chemotaxis protein